MYKEPIPLKKGDTVSVIAPAGKISSLDLQSGIEILEDWGLRVVLGDYLFEAYHQFAAPDEQRIQDLQAMIDSPKIRAIICARGGYGTTRIIDRIDFTSFLQEPKWIAGYSDITALHCHLHQRGVQSIHSIMPVTFGKEDTDASVESLRKVLFGESVQYSALPHELNRQGFAQGAIIGGNLSLLVTIIGTPSDIDTKGKILFIEDVGEYLYHLDRMMIQMKRVGKLKDLAGLIVGGFSEMKDSPTPFGKAAYEIIAEAVEEHAYPMSFGFPVGHEPVNMAIPCGRQATLSINELGARLSFPNHQQV